MQYDHRTARGENSLPAVSRLVFFGFAAAAAFFLFAEHRAHLLGWLPFLLFAACPLMHLFHHRGHGGGEEQTSRESGALADDPEGQHRH